MDTHGELEQYLLSRVAAKYSREDCNSFGGKFVSKLMLSED
jgi:hypothetical protein